MRTIQQYSMQVPHPDCIYQPSGLPKQMKEKKFLKRYSDHPRQITICPSGITDPLEMSVQSRQVTAYSKGLDCWWVIV